MRYRFPLTVLYRASYKDKVWIFRPLTKRDLRAASKWISSAVGTSSRWRRHFRRLLLQEYRITADLSQQYSWMLTVNNKRICWLEVLELEMGLEIYLAGPPHLLNDDRAALIIWSRAITFLTHQNPQSQFLVHLDISRAAEALALEQLGFLRDGEDFTR